MKNENNRALAVLLELPALVIQAAAILVLLALVYGNSIPTLFATIFSLIWIRLSHDDSAQDLMNLRVKRQLFASFGEWLSRTDAAEAFDEAHSEHMQLEHGVNHEKYTSVAMAKGIANLWRSAMSAFLHIYLVVVMILVAVDHVRVPT